LSDLGISNLRDFDTSTQNAQNYPFLDFFGCKMLKIQFKKGHFRNIWQNNQQFESYNFSFYPKMPSLGKMQLFFSDAQEAFKFFQILDLKDMGYHRPEVHTMCIFLK
jgi:hypothetical protein